MNLQSVVINILHKVTTFVMPPASDEDFSAIVIYCLSWYDYLSILLDKYFLGILSLLSLLCIKDLVIKQLEAFLE